MSSNLAEAVECLNEITKLQSDVINELFLLLMQHLSAEEVDRLPVLDKINHAAALRRDMGEVEAWST